MMKTVARRLFSSGHFAKGRLSLNKLREKATVDEQIDLVNIVFPD
jgi:hypothetical protein